MYRVAFLHSELSGYFLECLRALAGHPQVKQCLVFHWPVQKEAPFQLQFATGIEHVERIAYSTADVAHVADRLSEFQPDVVVTSGWRDPCYNQLCRSLCDRIPVVCSLDNSWRGSWRQWLAVLSQRLLHTRFTHLWVPGPDQYEYARRMGYASDRIMTGVYAAHVTPFHAAYHSSDTIRPRTLLYVGRIVKEKQAVPLYDIFHDLTDDERAGWKLRIVGTGDLAHLVKSTSICSVEGFRQPAELPGIAQEAGAYVLPSRFEPWGVTVQEFAAAGLPMLCSRQCGAAGAFVNSGYNGWTFDATDHSQFRSSLVRLLTADEEVRIQMGRRSHELSLQNSPELWATRLVNLAESAR